ncbi:hypothetical protein M8C21_009097, partial [Ambrosia artemisiifolia]
MAETLAATESSILFNSVYKILRDMDRISQLPESVVHHILSFLKTPAHLVRMSVLSKTWFHLTASFPILDFSIGDFRSRESFFKYVEYTISRFCHHNIPAQKLRLIKFLGEPADLDIVDRCLKRLLRNGVKKLVIYLHNFSDDQVSGSDSDSPSASDMPRYRLPNTLLSVSVLTSLTVFGCELPSSLMLDAPSFKSLIKLKLDNVYLNDEVITYLVASCPLLRVFKIRGCHGFKRFSVHGHQHLREVDISFDTPVERIDIEAPNLSELTIADEEFSGQPQMNLASCEKLTSVYYEGCPLPNSNGVNDFLSNFPFIENLVFYTTYSRDNLNLSSHSLKTLVLSADFDFDEIELSTPNLGLFIYPCSDRHSGLGISHLPHLNACMRCYPYDSISILWFHKLRLFLDKENGFKALNLYICTDQQLIVLEKIQEIELPPYELGHIELHFEHEESSDHAAFVDAVLCCFRPRSLTLRSSFPLNDFEEQSDLVKLPESVVHHILSFLKTPAHLVRMSVLSKTWFHLTASFPILDFSIGDFRSRESFFKYVEYTISRFCHHNIPAQKLRLIKFLGEPADLDIVDRCLKRLLRNGVKKLVIYLHNFSDDQVSGSDSDSDSPSASDMPRYRLPNTLLSVSVLTSLTVFGCELPSSLMLDAPSFKSLIKLKLDNVYLNDEVITYLVASCPLLRVFKIRGCHGFKRFSVHGHQHLREVDISFDTPVERIDIEAPNLSELTIADEEFSGQPQMNLASCEKLTSVYYEGSPLPNSNGVNDFLSNFPFIENLVFYTTYSRDNLNLSSHSLRTLVLSADFDFDEIELSTPNLGLFIYPCSDRHSGLGISHLPHLNACMRCYPYDSISILWFHKLRLFLDKENGFKALNLYICTDQQLIVLEKIQEIELPPYELEHIELHFEHEESSDHAAFVDAVLCCFRPRSLTLRSSFPLNDFEEQSDLVK